LVYRYWLAGNTHGHVDRSWKAAVSLGAGHGGCEAIILGLLLISTLLEMTELRHADLSKILPPDKVQEVREELNAYWSMTWYESFMPVVERVSAMTFHVSAAVLVLQVFLRRNIWWLGAAIGFHATIDAIAVVASAEKWNIVVTEALLAVLIIPLALKIIFYFRDAEQDEALRPLLAADEDEEANEEDDIEPAGDVEAANEEAADEDEEVCEHANEEANEQASEVVETTAEVAKAEERHSLC
jgi:hypothetical protein